MMRIFIVFLFSSAILLQSCTPKTNQFKVDETAKEVFSPTELEGIMEMIEFVDEPVLQHSKIADINEAYHLYFKKEKALYDKGEFHPAIVKDAVKFAFFESLDKNAVEAIWRISNTQKIVYHKGDTYTDLNGFMSISFNNVGTYMQYLKQTGESDKKHQFLYEGIEIAGDISQSIVGWFPANHSEFDFTNFKDRLWAVVYLLRIGDTLDEKMERYIKEQNSIHNKK